MPLALHRLRVGKGRRGLRSDRPKPRQIIDHDRSPRNTALRLPAQNDLLRRLPFARQVPTKHSRVGVQPTGKLALCEASPAHQDQELFVKRGLSR